MIKYIVIITECFVLKFKRVNCIIKTIISGIYVKSKSFGGKQRH